MLIQQYTINNLKDCHQIPSKTFDWVLCFGTKSLLEDQELIKNILEKFNQAEVTFCSTAGEISENGVSENQMIITAVKFHHTPTKAVGTNIEAHESSYAAGQFISQQLLKDDLKHVFVISDGSQVNGSELVKGLSQNLDDNVIITGGLAGDGTHFNYTLTGLNALPSKGNIIAFAMYGPHIRISYGSNGGWDSFGLYKSVTKSKGNELFEIDGRNALEMYKEHLGKYSQELPGAALLFPLSVKMNEEGDSVVRTILSINTERKSMIFAGDIPEGSKVKFMMANFDRLIDAAGKAAKSSLAQNILFKPQLAILISCVGRRIVLGERIDDEIEAVISELGSSVAVTGFYSYGEISPLNENVGCQLHNQTMTITCLQEIE